MVLICWSCERAAGDGAACSQCNAIQPPLPGADHFVVLGLPRRFGLDLAAAEGRFRELSRQVHPDRFAKADPRARRASLQRSVQLNEAWRAIKDPVRRAEYLLQLAGFDVGPDEGAARVTADRQPARQRIKVPPALLAEILESREELAEARADGDEQRVQRMASDMRGRVDAALGRVAETFARLDARETTDAVRDDGLGAAARELIAIRYYRRFLEEVATHDEATAARQEGAVHV